MWLLQLIHNKPQVLLIHLTVYWAVQISIIIMHLYYIFYPWGPVHPWPPCFLHYCIVNYSGASPSSIQAQGIYGCSLILLALIECTAFPFTVSLSGCHFNGQLLYSTFKGTIMNGYQI